MYKEIFAESVISCVFQKQFDDSGKICCIDYQICNQEGPQNFRECNGDIHHEIELNFDSVMPGRYCYTVTVGNDTHTVKVKGSFIAGMLSSS